jgi:PAS domain S-box-containing protein
MVEEKIETKSQEYADSIIDTVREPLIVLDQDLRVVSASRSFYEVFKVNPKDTVGQLIYDLGNKQWDIPKLRELLETILPQKSTFDDYEVEHDFATIGRRIMLLNARKIERRTGKEQIILLAIEDITEHKRLENLVAESEERYRRLFETATDGIVLLNKREGHIVQANPAALKMLGYSEEESIGKSLQEIGVPLDFNDFPVIMESLKKNGILNYDDVPVKTKSGQELYTDIYMVDRAKLAQCNIRDVTERKLADKILKEEKKFIENALNTLQDVFFVLDLEGSFLRWNKTMNAVTGYSDREIALMTITDFIRKDDMERVSEAIREVFTEGSVNIEAIGVTKDGRQIHYEWNAALLKDAHDNPIGVSGVGRDISEHKKAEAALRESEERFRQIAESAKEWIWEVNSDGLYTYASQVVEEMLGYTPEEIIGKKHFYDFFPAGKREQIKKEALASFAKKRAFAKYVNSNVHKNGSIVLLETSSTPVLNSSGNLLGYRGVAVDITEHQKLEAQLRHAQKMEAIGTLSGGIAHDFNNILNVIMGYGALAIEKLEAGSPSAKDMNEVLIAAHRAANLTRRLLVFSRRQVVEVKPVNINELILGIKKMLVRIISESIAFSLDLLGRPLMVLADAGQIEQALINLIVNAKDAMLDGGRLTIGTGLEEVDEEYVAAYGYGKPGRYAMITVADTGHGMDVETQKKIFEPFFTTKGVGEGTGLGLAIAYGIIKQHSGYIQVYSEPGQGTVFKIYLPFREETALPDKKTDAAFSVKSGNETVLVAEDDAALRTLTKIVLESFGYSVISSEDGEDAIAKFMENRERIGLILIDMIMPKKNGKEVCDAIRNVSPRVKILLTSGYTMDMIKTKELAADGFDFIHKPFQSKDLLIKVREILDR